MKKLFIPVIFLSLFVHPLFAQDLKTPSRYKKAVAAGRKNIADLMAKQDIPGFSIAVILNGKFVWSEGFGFSDLENHVKARAGTRYRIGSLSKLFTATAAAKLSGEGLLDLDAPVRKYVPGFPQKEFEITSRELAGHLAGMPHYGRDAYINQKRYASITDSLDVFKDRPLLHQPNSKYFYSSYGYVLLGAVIEGASKQGYADYLQAKVFGPLGMKGTAVDNPAAIIEDRARFYAKSNGQGLVNETYMDTSDRIPAGGFISTADDLAMFGWASAYGDLLKGEMRSILFTSQKTSDGKETNVGFGWRIGKDKKGRTIYHHGGDAVGGRAFLVIYPDSKLVIAVACNLTFAQFAQNEAETIADPFIGGSIR